MGKWVLSLLFLAVVAPPAHALAEGMPGARPGEAFTFKFSVGPIEGGRARMSVGHPRSENGRQLIAVHGQAETSTWLKSIMPLNDDYQLIFDARTLLPTKVVSLERGVRQRRIETKLDGRRAELDVKAQTSEHGVKILPEVVRDPLSALFALRAAPLKDGQVLHEMVLDGLALWRVKLSVHRGERIQLGATGKPRAAIRIDAELTPIDASGRAVKRPQRHLSLWLSDDPTRVLLRLEADTDMGRCALELTSYLPPQR